MRNYLTFIAGTKIGDELWFSNNYYNGLFCKKKGETARFISRFPHIEINKMGMHRSLIKRGNEEMVFIPRNIDYIHFYDHITGEITGISTGQKKPGYAAAFKMEDDALLLIPSYSIDSIEKIEPGEYQLKRLTSLIERTGNYYIARASYYDYKVWYAPYGGKKIVCWDIKTEEVRIFQIDVPPVFALWVISGRFLILPLTGSGIWEWDAETGKCRKLQMDLPESDDKELAYSQIVDFRDEIYVLPAMARSIQKLNDVEKHFFKISNENNTMKKWCVQEKLNPDWILSLGYYKTDEFMAIFPINGKEMLWLYADGNVEIEHIEHDDFSEGYVGALEKDLERILVDRSIRENCGIGLKHFVRYVEGKKC